MHLVADENVEAYVIRALRQAGHGIFSSSEAIPRADDMTVLDLSLERGEVLLTGDKDFGDLVFLHDRPNRRVVLMRLKGMRPLDECARMVMITEAQGHELKDAFATVDPKKMRNRLKR